MRTWHQLLQEGRRRLPDNEQAALLALNEIARNHAHNLYMEMDTPMPEEIQTEYLETLFRMEQGEPLDHVLGYTWFYGHKIGVGPDVLIPRPETEELVELVLELADEHFPQGQAEVFDVATGSGAIGIALALEEPRLHVTASDISEEALVRARENARSLGAPVDFLQGDMLEPFLQAGLRCDILVCNPPYIPAEEEIEASVRDHEPHVALFGGSDGLKFYRDVLARAGSVMKPGGILAFEMGWNQGERLLALARTWFPDARIQVRKDLNGKDRMLSVELKT